MKDLYIIRKELSPSKKVTKALSEFIEEFSPIEKGNKIPLLLHWDKKSDSYYITCHILGKDLSDNADIDATISDDDDELYKLNREITEDQFAYKQMELDAISSRTFEDIVSEYDKSYRSSKPLKIFGGQHRVKAITEAVEKGASVPQGIRVYFGLSREQKVEIAVINNTSIAVSNDLLDRMQEQIIGNELRVWCQKTGLLNPGTDFADKRSPEIPTVRIARTLIVNYHAGKEADLEDFHHPLLCSSGGFDEEYEKARKKVDWDDKSLLEMGKQFARLHKIQSERVKSRDYASYVEYVRKTYSYSIVVGWSYAAGLFQDHPEFLKILYSIPDIVEEPNDPLNAKALSEARLKGVDSDTYRGLGTRSTSREFGRVLELFIVLATKAKNKVINKKLANAAIQSFEAKKAVYEAEKTLGKI